MCAGFAQPRVLRGLPDHQAEDDEEESGGVAERDDELDRTLERVEHVDEAHGILLADREPATGAEEVRLE